jgi:hypothetical protein
MNISARTKTLLDRLPKNHPLSASMKAAMTAALAAGEEFTAHKSQLSRDARMTPLGRSEALRAALTDKFGKALARAAQPVVKARKEIKARRDAMKVKAIDPTNSVAELRRMEMRTYLCSLDLIERQSLALTTESQLVLESIVTAEVPGLAGFGGRELAPVIPQIQQRYFEVTFADEIKALDEMETVVGEAEAAIAIARNDMQTAVDLHPYEFNELMKPVETIRPWITKDGLQVCEPLPNGKASYRPATEADLAFGVQYENLAAWQAAQGFADAA